MIPGWPYSVIADLEPGRTSWTAVLDAVRLGPEDDETEVPVVLGGRGRRRAITLGGQEGPDGGRFKGKPLSGQVGFQSLDRVEVGDDDLAGLVGSVKRQLPGRLTASRLGKTEAL